MGKLRDKQERFCLEYIKDYNGQQAAIRAGYSKTSARSTASELLTYPNVQKRIQQLNSRVEKKAICTAQEIREILSNIARGGSDEEVTTDTTNELGEKTTTVQKRKTSNGDKVKACDTLAKMNGYYDTNPNVSISVNVPQNLQNLTPEQLLEISKGAKAKSDELD